MIQNPMIIKRGGTPENLRAIAVSADPPEGGSVSGGGKASDGMTVTVKAEAVSPYKFKEWQESGNAVSMDNEYAFQVDAGRQLVSIFEKSSLPDGYSKIEYIYTQEQGQNRYGWKIETGTLLDISSDTIFIDFEGTRQQATYYQTLCGWNLESNRANISLSYGTSLALMMNWNSYTRPSVNPYNNRVSVTIDFPNRKAVVNEQELSIASIAVPTGNLFLYNDPNGTSYSFIGKLYGCTVYSGEEVKANFIPCKNPDGEIALYEEISGEVFAPADNMKQYFLAGPAV